MIDDILGEESGNDDMPLPLQLILLEEAKYSHEQEESHKEVIVIDQRNITRRRTFSPTKRRTDGSTITFPIKSTGTLDSFVLQANSDQFSVLVEIDDNTVIDDDYTTLETYSDQFTHSGAFSRSGNYVVSVSNYPFRERINIEITPRGGTEVSFDLVRAEIILGEDSPSGNVDPEISGLLRR